jgi:hypothetical protein
MVLSQSAASHDVVPRRARLPRPPLGPNAEATYHPPVRVSWGRPRRTALPTLSLCTTCSDPPRRPPNGVAAVRAPRRPGLAIGRRESPPFPPYPDHAVLVLPRPSPWCARKHSTALSWAIKPTGLPPREHRAAVVRHGCHTVNSTPACFSSPTRAAPHSFRTPCSSCAHLLTCSSRQLAGVVSPAVVAGQPSTSSAPRAIPEPTNRLSPFPRSP